MRIGAIGCAKALLSETINDAATIFPSVGLMSALLLKD